MSSFNVAPLGRFSSDRMAAFLVPGRALGTSVVGGFFGAAFLRGAVAGEAVEAASGAARDLELGCSFFIVSLLDQDGQHHIHGSVAAQKQVLCFKEERHSWGTFSGWC